MQYGLVLLVRGPVDIREPHLDAKIGRVDRRHLLVDGDRLLEPVVLLVVVREDLVLAAGVLDEPLLVVEVRQLVVDLELCRVDLVDLLEDGDRLQEEPVLRVEVGDPGEEGDRLGRPGSCGRTGPRPCSGSRCPSGLSSRTRRYSFRAWSSLPRESSFSADSENLVAVDGHS